MKIGLFTTTNSKGQIVIPKAIRDSLKIDQNVTLNITLSGGGIHIRPVEEFLAKAETESSYLKLLKKTQGGWKDENWDEFDKFEKKRSRTELTAAQKLKKTSW